MTVSLIARTKAIAYLRVSTVDQAEAGVSLDAQEGKVRAYAELFDVDLVEVVRDAGVSAKSLSRPGLRRALDTLDRGDASAILVAKLDRLTRSVKDLGALLEEHFATDQASLISVAEQVDTRSAAGRLVLNVLVSVAQWEREAIGERTRDVLAHLRAQGVRMGAPGLGWRYSDDVDEHGHRVVEPVTSEAATIARILELKDQGLSVRKIASQLQAEGRRTKDGGRWHATTVQRIIRRERAA